QYVIDALAKQFAFDIQKSYWENFAQLTSPQVQSEEQKAYQMRLAMELINVAMEKQIRSGKNQGAKAILERLIKCEASAWK
ncbi:MAG: Caspase domain-containing protein, partial [Microcystaceae cyanobacterium]